MARTLKGNSKGKSSNRATGAPERPFFDQLVELFKKAEEIREDIKEVCSAAKEADILTGPLKLAVRRYLETEKERNARVGKEEECERILRALGEFVNTPLGHAAVNLSEERERRAAEPPISADYSPDPPEAA